MFVYLSSKKELLKRISALEEEIIQKDLCLKEMTETADLRLKEIERLKRKISKILPKNESTKTNVKPRTRRTNTKKVETK